MEGNTWPTWTEYGPFFVHSYKIIGTPTRVFRVYERAAGHSTQTSMDSESRKVTWLGEVATRPLPVGLKDLPPMSQARYAAVKEYQAALKSLAVSVILAAYPGLRLIIANMGTMMAYGEVVIVDQPVPGHSADLALVFALGVDQAALDVEHASSVAVEGVA